MWILTEKDGIMINCDHVHEIVPYGDNLVAVTTYPAIVANTRSYDESVALLAEIATALSADRKVISVEELRRRATRTKLLPVAQAIISEWCEQGYEYCYRDALGRVLAGRSRYGLPGYCVELTDSHDWLIESLAQGHTYEEVSAVA